MISLPQDVYDEIEKTTEEKQGVSKTSHFIKTQEKELKQAKEAQENIVEQNQDPTPSLTPQEKSIYSKLGERFFKGGAWAFSYIKDAINFQQAMSTTKSIASKVAKPILYIPKKIVTSNWFKDLLKGIGYVTLFYILFRTFFGGIYDGMKEALKPFFQKLTETIIKPIFAFLEPVKDALEEMISEIGTWSFSKEHKARMTHFLTRTLPSVINGGIKDATKNLLASKDKKSESIINAENAFNAVKQNASSYQMKKDSGAVLQTQEEIDGLRAKVAMEILEATSGDIEEYKMDWDEFNADFQRDICERFGLSFKVEGKAIYHNGEQIDTADPKKVAEAMLGIKKELVDSIVNVRPEGKANPFMDDVDLKDNDGNIDPQAVIKRISELMVDEDEANDLSQLQRQQRELLQQQFDIDGDTDAKRLRTIINQIQKLDDSTAVDTEKALEDTYKKNLKTYGNVYFLAMNKQSQDIRTSYLLKTQHTEDEINAVKLLLSIQSKMEGFLKGAGTIGFGDFVNGAIEAIQSKLFAFFKKNNSIDYISDIEGRQFTDEVDDKEIKQIEVETAYQFSNEGKILNFLSFSSVNTTEYTKSIEKVNEITFNYIKKLKKTNEAMIATIGKVKEVNENLDIDGKTYTGGEGRTYYVPSLTPRPSTSIVLNLTNIENSYISIYEGSQSENRR